MIDAKIISPEELKGRISSFDGSKIETIYVISFSSKVNPNVFRLKHESLTCLLHYLNNPDIIFIELKGVQ